MNLEEDAGFYVPGDKAVGVVTKKRKKTYVELKKCEVCVARLVGKEPTTTTATKQKRTRRREAAVPAEQRRASERARERGRPWRWRMG